MVCFLTLPPYFVINVSYVRKTIFTNHLDIYRHISTKMGYFGKQIAYLRSEDMGYCVDITFIYTNSKLAKLDIFFFIFSIFIFKKRKKILYCDIVLCTHFHMPLKLHKLDKKSPNYGQTFFNCQLFMAGLQCADRSLFLVLMSLFIFPLYDLDTPFPHSHIILKTFLREFGPSG